MALRHRILVALAWICVLLCCAEAQFAGGTGSSADPYLIETAEQLDAVRDHLTSHFLQVISLDLSSYTNWVPIGTDADPFTGTYRGESNTITNLTVDRPDEDYVGLFGYMAGSSWLRELSLTNVSVVGRNAVGAIAGFYESGSESRACHVWGSITGAGNNVGGLFGQFNGILRDCTADVEVEGVDHVAGMVGRNMPYHSSFTLERCVVNGSVKGRDAVAGIMGHRSRGSYLINYASVEGSNTVGGC